MSYQALTRVNEQVNQLDTFWDTEPEVIFHG